MLTSQEANAPRQITALHKDLGGFQLVVKVTIEMCHYQIEMYYVSYYIICQIITPYIPLYILWHIKVILLVLNVIKQIIIHHKSKYLMKYIVY